MLLKNLKGITFWDTVYIVADH